MPCITSSQTSKVLITKATHSYNLEHENYCTFRHIDRKDSVICSKNWSNNLNQACEERQQLHIDVKMLTYWAGRRRKTALPIQGVPFASLPCQCMQTWATPIGSHEIIDANFSEINKAFADLLLKIHVHLDTAFFILLLGHNIYILNTKSITRYRKRHLQGITGLHNSGSRVSSLCT